MKIKNTNKAIIAILFILLSFNITIKADVLENDYQTFYSEGAKFEIVSKTITKDKLKLECKVSNMMDSEIHVLGNTFYILDEVQKDFDVKVSKKFDIYSLLFNEIKVEPNQTRNFKITLENINNKGIYNLKGQIKKSCDFTNSATTDVNINLNIQEEI